MRRLQCDCGYVATGQDDERMVSTVQAHAWEEHRLRLSAALILALAPDGDGSSAGGAGRERGAT